MAEWIYFLHVDRENFAETMTGEEIAAWQDHFVRLQQLLADGTVILAGPTLGPVNTGIVIFNAPDEAGAIAIMNADPTIARNLARGELREMRVSLLAGRDQSTSAT